MLGCALAVGSLFRAERNRMDTFLIIAVLLFAAGILVLRQATRQPKSREISAPHEPYPFDGLFAPEQIVAGRELAQAEARLREEEQQERLLERAAAGDETALNDAHALGNAAFYRDVLQTLVRQTNDPERLRFLAEYIVDSHQLRAEPTLAARMIAEFGALPTQPSLPSLLDMLQLAALSDDVATFQHAVETALQLYRADKLPSVSAQDLLAGIESAYWLIATETRYSGSGFSLKQLIADVRRTLAAAPRRSA